MKGRLFRLESCSFSDGKVTLCFRSPTPSDGAAWWIEGEGFGDRNFAWIRGRIGMPSKPEPGPPNFYLAKGTWVRDLGEASIRAAEKIPNVRNAKQ
jgi:hypothetical protein